MIRRSWMTGISIETTLELWASSLRAVKARMAPLFTQERVAASAGLFLDGLLADQDAKITNCQIGVFCAYVSRHGHAFIDRALYLPKAWTDDPIRMTATHVPNGIAFATKPALAVKMISQALAANVPFSWVAADSVYGVGDIEMALRHAGKGYVLGVSANRHFGSWRGKPPVAVI